MPLSEQSCNVLRRPANDSSTGTNNDRPLQQNRMFRDRVIDLAISHVGAVKTQLPVFSLVYTNHIPYRTTEHPMQIAKKANWQRLLEVLDYLDRLVRGAVDGLNEMARSARL